MCNVHFIGDLCSGSQECRKPDLPFCPGACQDMPGGRHHLTLHWHILVHAVPLTHSHRHAGHTPIMRSPVSSAKFKIEVLPQGSLGRMSQVGQVLLDMVDCPAPGASWLPAVPRSHRSGHTLAAPAREEEGRAIHTFNASIPELMRLVTGIGKS